MDYFRVNGKSYNVVVTSLEESFEILYTENSGRTLAEGAPMTLDPIGAFFGHKITIKRKAGFETEYDELYLLLAQPRRVEEPEDALLFEVAHLQDTIAYRAYVSNGARAVIKIDEKTNKVYWGELSLNIVPIKAQVLPDSVVNEDTGDEPPETDGGDTDTITFRIEDWYDPDNEWSTYTVPNGTTWREAVADGYLLPSQYRIEDGSFTGYADYDIVCNDDQGGAYVCKSGSYGVYENADWSIEPIDYTLG